MVEVIFFSFFLYFGIIGKFFDLIVFNVIGKIIGCIKFVILLKFMLKVVKIIWKIL